MALIALSSRMSAVILCPLIGRGAGRSVRAGCSDPRFTQQTLSRGRARPSRATRRVSRLLCFARLVTEGYRSELIRFGLVLVWLHRTYVKRPSRRARMWRTTSIPARNAPRCCSCRPSVGEQFSSRPVGAILLFVGMSFAVSFFPGDALPGAFAHRYAVYTGILCLRAVALDRPSAAAGRFCHCAA
jgi:hypothetical protein